MSPINIQFGLGIDQRIDLAHIANTVEEADIIALHEINGFGREVA